MAITVKDAGIVNTVNDTNGVLHYDYVMTLTDTQKAQARDNIGLEEFSTSDIDTIFDGVS